MTTTTTPAARVSGTIKALMDALTSALEWIDAVPPDTPLPTMPGFDRDAVDNLLAAIQTDLELQPVAVGRQHFEPKRDSDLQPWGATPSSAGMVSVEAAALREVLAKIRDSESFIYSGDDLRGWADESLRALAGEGDR